MILRVFIWNNFIAASSTSDDIVPETEKLFLEGKIVQKLECRPAGTLS